MIFFLLKPRFGRYCLILEKVSLRFSGVLLWASLSFYFKTANKFVF